MLNCPVSYLSSHYEHAHWWLCLRCNARKWTHTTSLLLKDIACIKHSFGPTHTGLQVLQVKWSWLYSMTYVDPLDQKKKLCWAMLTIALLRRIHLTRKMSCAAIILLGVSPTGQCELVYRLKPMEKILYQECKQSCLGSDLTNKKTACVMITEWSYIVSCSRSVFECTWIFVKHIPPAVHRSLQVFNLNVVFKSNQKCQGIFKVWQFTDLCNTIRAIKQNKTK